MGGASAKVFVHHHVLGGGVAGGAGGDEPSKPWLSLKSAHEADAVASWRDKLAAMTAAAERDGRFRCPLCDRHFSTEKAVHGHMRSHPGRGWRGMEPPREPSPGELAADGKRYRYVCALCKAPFETRQALGGHRASHSSKKGCSWHARQLAMEMAKPPKHDFNLNDLSPEAQAAAAAAEAAAAEAGHGKASSTDEEAEKDDELA
ncbi:zinc finger protein 36-like [Oryza brachyantha]|nr:zinc finger protein 36-like [Oryza brachyantha]